MTGIHDLDLALSALRELPVRQQQIFLAWWRDEKSQAEIASLFGLHKRTVQKELARTEAYIRRSLRDR
ncbi:MAG TPA: sigma-70 region 4 domain-containing protein [Sphingobium sp.]